MEVLVKIAQLLLSLSILVILHEFGHFAFAKLFKTRVEKFYLFFNPWFSLFKRKIGETEYGIGWVPLGGYVKISGMIDESMDKEQMKKPPEPHEFRSKPTWQRLLIMLGGVMVNFILALFIYSAILFVWGSQYLPTKNVTYGITADSVAQSIGFNNGDKILSVDNKYIEDFHQIVPTIVLDEAKTVQIERNGKEIDIKIPKEIISVLLNDPGFISLRIPFIVDRFTKESKAKSAGLRKGDEILGVNNMQTRFFDQFADSLKKIKADVVNIAISRDNKKMNFDVRLSENGIIGVAPFGSLIELFELKYTEYGFFQSIPAGINKGVETFKSYLKQLKLIFSPETEAYKSLGGFITIGNIFPGTWDWHSFWSLTAFLSIILAIMNVLPIPALDGGHVVFLLYEMITGRKPNDKVMEYAQIAGMIILFSLLIFANGNDIIKWITGNL
ncbi:MAG: RIP metalloprotease RseP [Bacteroidales bacterium]|jgi:regulator of sigma E protease|nr:RIP metalloprotease RseP [Bacteroidales bacterium]